MLALNQSELLEERNESKSGHMSLLKELRIQKGHDDL